MGMVAPDGQSAYRDELYDRYVSTHCSDLSSGDHADRDSRYYRVNLLTALPTDRKAKILEVGCGSGRFLKFLQDTGYTSAFGVDLSPEQIEVGKRLGVSNLILGDAMTFLAESTDLFDVIVAIDVVEHLRKDEFLRALTEIHRSLRPGGCVVIHTVNADSPFFGHYFYGDLTHELALNTRSLSQAIRAAGFATCETREVKIPVHGIASAVRWLAWRVVAALVRTYLAVETGVMRGHVVSQNLVAIARRE